MRISRSPVGCRVWTNANVIVRIGGSPAGCRARREAGVLGICADGHRRGLALLARASRSTTNSPPKPLPSSALSSRDGRLVRQARPEWFTSLLLEHAPSSNPPTAWAYSPSRPTPPPAWGRSPTRVTPTAARTWLGFSSDPARGPSVPATAIRSFRFQNGRVCLSRVRAAPGAHLLFELPGGAAVTGEGGSDIGEAPPQLRVVLVVDEHDLVAGGAADEATHTAVDWFDPGGPQGVDRGVVEADRRTVKSQRRLALARLTAAGTIQMSCTACPIVSGGWPASLPVASAASRCSRRCPEAPSSVGGSVPSEVPRVEIVDVADAIAVVVART